MRPLNGPVTPGTPHTGAVPSGGNESIRGESRGLTGNVVWAVVLAMLCVADLVATRAAVAAGAIEANPVMAPLIGTGWDIALKIAVPLTVVALSTRPVSRRYAAALRAVTVFYAVVVVWNVSVWAVTP